MIKILEKSEPFYEVPILIQYQSQHKLSKNDPSFNQGRNSLIETHYPGFLKNREQVLQLASTVLQRYPKIESFNQMHETGLLLGIVLNADAMTMKDFSLEDFTRASLRMILSQHINNDLDEVKQLITKLDQIYANQVLDSVELFNVVSDLDTSNQEKFEIVRIFNDIESLYEEYCECYHALLVILEPFVKQYESLIRDNYEQYGRPEKPEDWGVDRWIDFKRMDQQSPHSVYMISLIHIEGLMARIGMKDKGNNVIIKGIFLELFSENESSDLVSIETVSHKILALGDTKRLQIFSILQTRPHYAKELSTLLKLSPSTVSHHIDILTSAGLIKMVTEGRRVYYSINTQEMKDLAQYFTQLVAKGDDNANS